MVVNELYNQPGYKPHFHNSDTPVELSFNFDDDVLKGAMKRLYQKKYNPLKEIDEELFNQFWDIYNDAADKGLQDAPPLDYGDKDADFYNELQYNNGVFAAFKTHRMQNDMASQLMGEDGKLKTFAEWEKDTRSIRDHHVGSWLETEYNTAVNRAHIAGQWRQFEREKDILPNLEWMRTTSVTPGKDHEPFWGVILPIDHPFWTKHKPGDRWGCKCGLRSTDAPVKPPIGDAWDNPVYDPSVGLDNNPGKDAMLFSFSHPYFAAAYWAYKKLMPIVKKFVDKQVLKKLNSRFPEIKSKIDPFNGMSIRSKNFIHGEIIVLRRSLEDIKEHSYKDVRVLSWLTNFNEKKLRGWNYLGWDYPKPYHKGHPKYDKSNPNRLKHPETDCFLYYELKIAGKTYYANVKMHKYYNKEVLYTIESKKPDKVRKGTPGKE